MVRTFNPPATVEQPEADDLPIDETPVLEPPERTARRVIPSSATAVSVLAPTAKPVEKQPTPKPENSTGGWRPRVAQ